MTIGIEAISYVGTTLLSMILGSHPDCLSVGHCYLFFSSYGKRKQHILEKENVCSICDLIEKGCSLNVLKLARHIKPKDAYKFINSDKIIIDSSSTSSWFNESVPNRIVWVFRDPISLGSSYKKSGKTIEYMCKAYNKYSKANGLAIEYSNILEDTPTLRNLFKALGLEYSPKYLEYWNYDNHMIGGSNSVLINIAKHKCPEKVPSMIQASCKGNEQYREYYKNDFIGDINLLTKDEEVYIWQRCRNIYEHLKKIQDDV